LVSQVFCLDGGRLWRSFINKHCKLLQTYMKTLRMFLNDVNLSYLCMTCALDPTHANDYMSCKDIWH
jgi:hypothetical protein